MANLRGGSTSGGVKIATIDDVPFKFRDSGGKLQYSLDGVTWKDVEFTGDATASATQILSGKTAYVSGAKVTGTMSNHGAKTYTPSTVNQTLGAGYISSLTVNGDADLISANIKAGKNIFGVSGSTNVVDTSAGNLVAGAVLTGYKGFSDGVQVTGTMTDKYNTDNITATTEVSGNTLKYNIPTTARYRSGYHLVASDNDWVESNIKSGVNIFGKTGTCVQATGNAVAGDVLSGKTFSKSGSAGLSGTMANRGAVVITPTTTNQAISAGYHNGSGYVVGDASLVAGNIKSGVNIFGVAGTLSANAAYGITSISGTGFTVTTGFGADFAAAFKEGDDSGTSKDGMYAFRSLGTYLGFDVSSTGVSAATNSSTQYLKSDGVTFSSIAAGKYHWLAGYTP